MTKLDERPDVTLDFELMFGEMPEVPCDGPNHGKNATHDEGPGKHYFKLLHSCESGTAGDVVVRCERKSQFIMEDLMRMQYATEVRCPCGTVTTPDKWVKYIGPVGLTG